MGKSTGGGGGGGGKIGIPPALGSNQGSLYYNAFEPLGTFGSSTLQPLQGLSNWAANIATGGNAGQNYYSAPGTGMLTGQGGYTFAPFTTFGGGTASGSGLNPFNGGGSAAGSTNQTLGPLLSNAFGTLGLAQNSITGPGGLTGLLASTSKDASKMMNLALGKTGLFPSQQAMINQAVSSQQSAVQQQLSNEGLGTSTVSAQLHGQIALSGAAAAGELVQGNIQLAQDEQKIQLATQAAISQEYLSISQLSTQDQLQMWNEAINGYGAIGSMMNSTLSSFGYAMKTQEDVLQANETEAEIQSKIDLAQAEAAQQGFGSLMGGIGSILGASNNSIGGSFLSGIGSLLGSTGGGLAASGIGAGTSLALSPSAGAALGAGGSAIAGGAGGAGILGSIGGFLTALFCQIARSVYGVEDVRWLYFRDWLIFRGPRPLRKFYVRNASWISSLVRRYWLLKSVLRFIFDRVIEHDQRTRET